MSKELVRLALVARYAGPGWSDSKIVEALETGLSKVGRVRKPLVEEGLEAVLSRK